MSHGVRVMLRGLFFSEERMQSIGKNMTAGSPLRLILALSLPLMVANAFQQLYTVADTAIVGRVLGLEALAALGAVDWFNWMMLSIVQGLAQGFSVRMAQQFGAGDGAGLRRTIGNACSLSAICAVALTAAAQLLTPFVLRVLETPPSIVDTSLAYIRIIFWGLPVVMAFNLFSAILRSVGDGRTPLLAMIFACAVNISLDLLFVASFDMGVEGAAIATVIAQGCSALICLRALWRSGLIRVGREDLRPDVRLCLRLMALGAPVAVQNMVISVGGMIVQRVVNSFDVVFVAGYTATNKLYGVLEIAATSFGYAMTVYVGQNLGVSAYGRIRRGVRAGVAAGVLTSALICAAMLLFGKSLLSGFITSQDAAEAAQALEYAMQFLRLMSVFLPVLYILHIIRSSLQGMGDTLFPMFSGLAELAMRVGAALFLPALLGYEAVFVGEVLAWAGADVILLTRYLARSRRFPAADGACEAPSR